PRLLTAGSSRPAVIPDPVVRPTLPVSAPGETPELLADVAGPRLVGELREAGDEPGRRRPRDVTGSATKRSREKDDSSPVQPVPPAGSAPERAQTPLSALPTSEPDRSETGAPTGEA